jgi:hypothetical protein
MTSCPRGGSGTAAVQSPRSRYVSVDLYAADGPSTRTRRAATGAWECWDDIVMSRRSVAIVGARIGRSVSAPDGSRRGG